MSSFQPHWVIFRTNRNQYLNFFLQFDFDFVDVSRVEQCHIRAITEYQQKHQDEDSVTTPLSNNASLPTSVSKDRSVGTWNVDGEILNELSVLVR